MMNIFQICNLTWSQFRQHFIAFFANILLPIKPQTQSVITEKLQKALLYKKGASKIMMILTPGVNLTNILRAAFLPIFFANKISNTN